MILLTQSRIHKIPTRLNLKNFDKKSYKPQCENNMFQIIWRKKSVESMNLSDTFLIWREKLQQADAKNTNVKSNFLVKSQSVPLDQNI